MEIRASGLDRPHEGWSDPEATGIRIPASFADGGAWTQAVRALDRLDPHRVFSNPFLDRLLT